jgi:sulfite reductase (NADPH) hemoprotein beta-component
MGGHRLFAMSYGTAYVASIAHYASYSQALVALAEADAFDGPVRLCEGVFV